VSCLERSSLDRLTASAADSLELLERGDIEILGLLPYSSNYVFLAKLSCGESEGLAVYKPSRGERPLWDFAPGTLAAREVAAFLVSEAAGWGFVPPTVLRDDAPMGPGSLQLYVEHDPNKHIFVFAQERLGDLAPFAAFDAVINNADRKAGHVIEDARGRLWGVDHGLSFNVEPKLRTVIWEFARRPLDPTIRATLECLRRSFEDPNGLRSELERLLSGAEARATLHRLHGLLAAGRFPSPGAEYHHLPWPLI
jgi:hypothetical protein